VVFLGRWSATTPKERPHARSRHRSAGRSQQGRIVPVNVPWFNLFTIGVIVIASKRMSRDVVVGVLPIHGSATSRASATAREALLLFRKKGLCRIGHGTSACTCHDSVFDDQSVPRRIAEQSHVPNFPAQEPNSLGCNKKDKVTERRYETRKLPMPETRGSQGFNAIITP